MPKTPYLFYMLHFKTQEEKKGRRFPGGMNEVKDAASESWQQMTKDERRPYEEKSRSDKSSNTGSKIRALNAKVEKYTSQGVSCSQIMEEKLKKEKEEDRMKIRIKDFIRSLDFPQGFANCPIYIMAGNYFYIYKDQYIPAELAISKFSLEKGIIKKYHTFLNPGDIHLGYRADAKMHSEQSHRLPLPPDIEGETDFSNIYAGIIKILQSDIGTFDGGKPMVFANDDFHDDQVLMIKSFMRQFSKREDSIDVFPMSLLLFKMQEVLAEKNGRTNQITIHLARALLDRDVFEFRRDISCDFHETADQGKYCAQSMVVRWSYLLCDILCKDVGVELKPGKHVPIDADIPKLSKSMSRLSVYSNSFHPNMSAVSSSTSRMTNRSQIVDAIPELVAAPFGTSMISDEDSTFNETKLNESTSEIGATCLPTSRRFWTPNNTNTGRMSAISEPRGSLAVPDGSHFVRKMWMGAGRGKLFTSNNTLGTLSSADDTFK